MSDVPESRYRGDEKNPTGSGRTDPSLDLREPSQADATAAEAAEVALDHALIRRANAGEEAAFESLVRRHQQRAWRIARNLVPTDEDAQDLAQEAFVRVFKSLANFDYGHAFTTWLYRIVTNLSIDHLRRRRPAVSTARGGQDDESEFDIVDVRAKAPSASLESRELSEDVRATLASLAPHFQSVLLLREMEGLPCNEIAHIVGATHVTVRWRLHRGRKLFQEEWERRARLREKGGDRAIETGMLECESDDGEPSGREADDCGSSDGASSDGGGSNADRSRRNERKGNDARKTRGEKRDGGDRGGDSASRAEGEQT